jgi:hypothetical protein
MHLAQMDIGPMLPSACAVTGFIIIPATMISWFLLLRHGRRVSYFTIFLIALGTPALVVWIVMALSLRNEPSIDDSGAVSKVEQLPEVQNFLQIDNVKHTADVIKNNNDASSDWLVAVVDYNTKPPVTWNQFKVNAVTGNIRVLADPKGHLWIPIDEWRKAQATTRP